MSPNYDLISRFLRTHFCNENYHEAVDHFLVGFSYLRAVYIVVLSLKSPPQRLFKPKQANRCACSTFGAKPKNLIIEY